MTISTTAVSVAYTGNGSTTAFAVPFAFFAASELEVIERVISTGVETVKTLTTHYTVSGGDGSTGTVTAVSAPASTVQWHIRRKTTKTQTTDYVENDPFPASSHERALDRLTAQTQEVAGDVARAIVAPKTDTDPQLVLPPDVERAGKALYFDENGDVAIGEDDYADQLANVTAQATAAAASADAASDSETAAAGSASAAASSASSASSSASSASTSASAAASSASAASDSATAAAASAASIVGDADAAAASATQAEAAQTAAEAAQTAAETAETNAETAATNASTSATNASTSATAASGSATTASNAATAAQTAQTAAETAETNAEAAQAAAETAETNAETAATNASNSATAAATSATNAAASATAAEAAAVVAGAPYMGCRLTKSGAQAISGSTPTNVVFETEAEDTDGFHDTGSNTDRITIPADVERVQLGCMIEFTTPSSGALFVSIKDDGGNVVAGQVLSAANNGTDRVTIITPDLPVSPADYFVVEVFCASAGSVTANSVFWLTVRKGPITVGTGDVVGPASSTNGNLASFSGTGGKTIQDSGIAAGNVLVDADIGVTVQAYDADLATWAGVTSSANGRSLVSAANYAAMRALLDLEAGTDFYSISGANAAFQPLDADLTAIAALANTDGNFIVGNGSTWVVESGSTARASMGAAASTVGQGKHTIWVPAGAMIARTTNGAASGTAESTTNKVMQSVLDFDAATAEYAQFQIAAPKSWNEGTVTAQFIWLATNTGNCVWGIQGLARSDDDVLDTAFGTAQTVTDGVTATTDVMISAETSAVTLGGSPAEGDLLIFQVYRDAANGSDTLAVDARLLGVRLFYTTNAATDD